MKALTGLPLSISSNRMAGTCSQVVGIIEIRAVPVAVLTAVQEAVLRVVLRVAPETVLKAAPVEIATTTTTMAVQVVPAKLQS